VSRAEPRPASLVGLAGRLSAQTRRLLRLEVRLLRAEVARGARRMAGHLALLVAGLTLGLVALGTAVATVVLALAEVMPAWTAALVVCVAAGAVGLPLALVGARGLLREPKATAERIEEDAEWTTPT
jgi:hypothetical protein